MKKILTLLLVFTLGLSLASCTNEEDMLNAEDAAQKLSLDVEKLNEITQDLVLPAEGLHSATITWASDNEAVVATDGTVTRPAVGEADVTVTLTATVTVGEESTTKEFQIKVLASVPSMAVTIAEVESADMADNTVVEVTGTVIGLINPYGYQLADETGSVYVYLDGTPTVSIGDNVTILGTKITYYNMVEIVDLQSEVVNSSGNALPEPTEISFGHLANQDITTTTWYNDFFSAEVYVDVRGEEGDEDVYLVWFDNNHQLVEGLVYVSSSVTETPAGVTELMALDGKTAVVDFILKDYHSGYGVWRVTVNGTGVATEAASFSDTEKANLALGWLAETFTALPTDMVVGISDLPEAWVEDETVTYTYSSSNEDILAADGAVTLPVGKDEYVTFYIDATSGTLKRTASYEFKVKDANSVTPISVTDALALEDGEIVIVEGTVVAAYRGVHIVDAAGAYLYVEDVDAMVGDNVVVQGLLETYDSYGNARRQLTNTALVNVKSQGNTVPAAVTTVDAATLAGAINTYLHQTLTMTLTYEGSSYGNFDFVGAGDVDVVMKDDYFPSLEDYLDANNQIEVTFVVHEVSYNDAMVIPLDFPGLTEADVKAIVEDAIDPGTPLTADVELMTAVEFFGATITWATSDAAVIALDGTVVRPDNGDGDANVNLTASITIGDAAAYDKVFAVVVTETPAAPDTVAEVLAAGHSLDYTVYTAVFVKGVVAGFTDEGYIIQDPATGKLLAIVDDTNTPTLGDEVAVAAEFNATHNVPQVKNVSTYEVLSTGNTPDFSTTNAVAMDFANFDIADYANGELVAVTGPWVKLYSGGTSYARLGNSEASVNDKSFGGKHVGLQNGANELNLTGTLADTFTGGDTPTEYANVTLYIVLYDATSSYFKFVVLDDSLIVVTPAS